MDCQSCEDRLMDLLYEEIEGTEAEEARAHLAECDSCHTSFEQLGSVHRMAAELPMEEPSAQATDAILKAARAKAAAHDGAAEARHDDDGGERRGIGQAMLDWLRGLTIGPQVAMAAVMMLMVAIGLWYLPGDRHGPDAAGETVVSPDLGDEAAPSGALEATPETEEVAAEELAEAEAPAAGRRGAAAPSRQPRSEERAPSFAEAETRSRKEAGKQAGEQAARMPGRAQAASPKKSRANRALADEDQGAIAQAPMPAPYAQGPESDGYDAEGALGGAPPQQRSSVASGGGASAEQEQASAGTRDDYERGMSRYRSKDYRGAIEDLDDVVQRPDPTAQPLVPSALHHLARSYRANGACAIAVRHYESLLSRYRSSYGKAPQAMLEAADCYRRTGRFAKAQHWLEQAEKYNSTQVAARRELERVQRMRRARREAAGAVQAAPAEAAEVEAH